jgi:nitrogen regulatory protein PII
MFEYTGYTKLLICTVGRGKGDQLMRVCKERGARGGTIMLGRSSKSNRLLQALSLADVLQDVVCTLMRDECQSIVDAISGAASAAPNKFGGVAMLIDVASVLSRVAMPGEATGKTEKQNTGDDMQSSGYKLITIIVNSGHGDDVMEAARKAGAGGGTLMSARGTGTEDDVKFFGITLVPEKDMLLIACEDSKLQAVMDAIGEVPSLNQPGGGIAYTIDIEKFIKLGAG